jgi:hypothetical protein
VRRGKPKNPENYERLAIEGVNIYYKLSVAASFGKITVRIERLLFIKSLVATGDK